MFIKSPLYFITDALQTTEPHEIIGIGNKDNGLFLLSFVGQLKPNNKTPNSAHWQYKVITRKGEILVVGNKAIFAPDGSALTNQDWSARYLRVQPSQKYIIVEWMKRINTAKKLAKGG